MARSYALGNFLKKSDRQKPQSRKLPTGRELRWWRIKGCLWFLSLLCALLVNLIGSLSRRPPPYMSPPAHVFFLVVLCSILCAAWDPTYSAICVSRSHGRDLRVRGKELYIIFQLMVWCSRVLSSCLHAFSPAFLTRRYFQCSLCLEITLLLASKAVIRTSRPPRIRLLDTHKHVSSRSSSLAPGTSPPSEVPLAPPTEDVFSGLSLSSKPVVSTAVNPIFGVPSFPAAPPSPALSRADDDAMDWSPTGPQCEGSGHRKNIFQHGGSDEDFHEPILRTQRFFPPEQPTGLESLLASTLLDDSALQPHSSAGAKWWKWS
jgi:hypothetical protein